MPRRRNLRKTPHDVLQGRQDPVCGMALPTSAPYQAEHRGRLYSFCSKRCAGLFEATPLDYLERSAPMRPNSRDIRGGHPW